MLSDTDHRKGPLPKFWVCKPETTQNLTSTNICIFAVFCVCRRSRLMTNSKRDLIRGQKHSQPMEQGVGTSLDPLRLPRLLAEPLGVPSGPPQTAGNAHKRGHSSGGGAAAAPVPARGAVLPAAAGSPNNGDVRFEPLGRPRLREPGIFPHQRRCPTAMDTIVL